MSANEDKTVVDMSDEELTAIGLLGSSATAQVEETIKAIRKFPNQFKWLTVFQLECLHTKAIHRPDAPVSPILSPSRDAPILSNVPRADNTAVETELISAFEKAYFYHGLSLDPPKLFHRSDLLTRPFAMQTKGKFSKIPQKTAHGVYDQVLNPIWRSMVCPEIVALLKDKNRGVRVSSILPVRFSTPDDNDNPVFGPIVIWISVHPRTTAVTACRDANPDILAILESHGVMGAAVHWIEGAVEPLVSPAMMHVVDDTNPTAYIRRALTASLGIPLVTADNNSQGSLGIYFHEGKDEQGNESDRVFAITNKHVVSRVTNTDYDILRAGSSKQYVRVCDYHRLQGVVNETRASIATKIRDAVRLIEVLADLPARPPPRDQNKAAMYAKRMEIELEYLREDAATLQKFLHNLNLSWSDPYRRFIGWVDWAPSIRNDIDDRRYTRDIGVIELEKSKWEKAFNGNQVYLGGKYTPYEVETMFCPNNDNPSSFEYPLFHLFKVQNFVEAADLMVPYSYDKQGNTCFIVAKNGQTTDLTFGRFSALEAYTCDEFENDSWQAAVFNFDTGSFSAKGDSGSLIFNAKGKMVAFVHSGMPRGLSNHVTFGTPAHFVIEQIRERFPHADFDRDKF